MHIVFVSGRADRYDVHHHGALCLFDRGNDQDMPYKLRCDGDANLWIDIKHGLHGRTEPNLPTFQCRRECDDGRDGHISRFDCGRDEPRHEYLCQWLHDGREWWERRGPRPCSSHVLILGIFDFKLFIMFSWYFSG